MILVEKTNRLKTFATKSLFLCVAQRFLRKTAQAEGLCHPVEQAFSLFFAVEQASPRKADSKTVRPTIAAKPRCATMQ
jgi:hypothetical protein